MASTRSGLGFARGGVYKSDDCPLPAVPAISCSRLLLLLWLPPLMPPPLLFVHTILVPVWMVRTSQLLGGVTGDNSDGLKAGSGVLGGSAAIPLLLSCFCC